MTKLNEVERITLASWNAVIDTLVYDIQHQQKQVTTVFDSEYADTIALKAYLGAMHRAAKALTAFVETNYADCT